MSDETSGRGDMDTLGNDELMEESEIALGDEDEGEDDLDEV
jgi:hypothetical protein